MVIAVAGTLVGCAVAPSPTTEPTRLVPTPWPTAEPTPTGTPLPTLTPSVTPTASPTPVPGLTWPSLRDLAYPVDGIQGDTVTLVDEPSADSSVALRVALADIHAFGDLDGDLVDDVVVVLTAYRQDDGPYFYLSAVLNRDGEPEPTAAVPIAERVIFRSISVQAGRVAVEMIVQDADDPLGYPVQDSRRAYELGGDGLELTSRWDAPAKSLPAPKEAVPAPLSFLPGARSTKARGAMDPVGDRRFLMPGVTGETATLTVTSPYDHVFLSISGLDDGVLLNSVISETTTWSGPFPSTQDYLVTLVSVSGSVTPFTLEVALSNAPMSAAPVTPTLQPTATPRVSPIPSATAILTPTTTVSVTVTPTATDFRRVPPGSTLYLTFDDGPGDGDWTSKVLDILAEHEAQATFFVIGRLAAQYPALVQTELNAGHAVGGHTDAHQTLDIIGRSAFFTALASTVQSLPGGQGTCMRPPYGALDAYTRVRAEELGYRVVLWDVDSEDWRRPGADVIARRVLATVRPGAVLLFHDGGGDREQTLIALEVVLPALRARGYQFEALCQQ
ncbi:MAG: polysaccharide deacetylase family protein [Anaerolineae bacterium]